MRCRKFLIQVCISLLALGGCIPVGVRQPSLHEPSELASLDPDIPPLKIHMLDATLYALNAWDAVGDGDSVIAGSGKLYGADRTLITEGEFSIPLDSIAVVESNQTNVSRPFGLSFLAIQTVLWGVLTAACVSDPKSCFGSCPTFYIDEVSDDRPLAEGFSSSISRSLEATDVDDLGITRPGGSRLEIRMRNEALETHAVRGVRLRAVPRRTNTPTYATAAGAFFNATQIELPVNCSSSLGDCLEHVRSHDALELTIPADSTDLAATEWVELTFPRVEGRAGLVVAARQTFVSTYLFYQTMAYLGRNAGDWLARLERNDPTTLAAYHNLAALTGVVRIYLNSAGDNWIELGNFAEAGPIASDVHLIPIGADMDADTVRIRLAFARGSWRIGHVALVHLEPVPDAILLEPSEVTGGPRGVDASTLLASPDQYLVTYPGDEITLTFELPPDSRDYALFLESSGYYYEWMRSEWLGEENPLMIAQLFSQPRAALRVMAPHFKLLEPTFEQSFWQSRFAR